MNHLELLLYGCLFDLRVPDQPLLVQAINQEFRSVKVGLIPEENGKADFFALLLGVFIALAKCFHPGFPWK